MRVGTDLGLPVVVVLDKVEDLLGDVLELKRHALVVDVDLHVKAWCNTKAKG